MDDSSRLSPTPVIGAIAHRVDELDRDIARRRRRIRLSVALAVAAALACAIAALPRILSTDRARASLLGRANRALAGQGVTLDADAWRLSWTGPQEIDGLRVEVARPDISGSATVPKTTVEATLWQLIPFSRFQAGRVTLSCPDAEFVRPVAVTVAVPAAAGGAGALPSGAGLPPAENGGLPAAKSGSAPSGGPEPGGAPQTPATRSSAPTAPPVIDLSAILVVEQGRLRFTDVATASTLEAAEIDSRIEVPSLRSPATATLAALLPAPGGAPGRISADTTVSNPIDWILGKRPEISGTLRSENLDLPPVFALLPAGSGLPAIDSGRLSGRCTVSAGADDALAATVALAGGGLHVAGSAAPPADAQLSGSFAWDRGRLSISDGVVTSPWVSAAVAGDVVPPATSGLPMGHLQANLHADLPALARDFGDWLGLKKGAEVRTGLLQATLGISSDGSTSMLAGNAAVAGPLELAFDGEELSLAAPSAEFALRQEGAGTPVAIDKLNVATSFGRLAGAGDSGGARFLGAIDLAAFRRDCGRFFHNLPEMAGTLDLDGSLAFSVSGGTAATLSAKAAGLAIGVSGSSPFRMESAALRATATISAERDAASAVAFRMDTPAGVVSGSCERVAWAAPAGDDADAAAGVEVRGGLVQGDLDCGRLRALLAPWDPLPEKTELRGRAIAGVTFLFAKRRAAANADIALRSLRYASPSMESPFEEPSARIGAKVEWSGEDNAVKVAGGMVESSWLSLSSAAATVEGEGPQRRLTASGELAFDWGRLSEWLAAKPKPPDISIRGREARAFRVSGPLDGGLDGFLARAEGSAATHVASLEYRGLRAEPADVEAAFSDGVAHLRYAPAVNGGAADVACDLAFTESPRRISTSRRLFLLKDVTVTDDMLHDLLGYANPLFTQCDVRNGKANLSAMPLDLPLDSELIRKSSFHARLELSDMELAPSDDFASFLKVAKLSGHTLTLKKQAFDIDCKDGRVSTGTQQFHVWRVPVLFGGTVSLDGDVDYAITVPVSQAVGKDYAKYVEGKSITVPVGGKLKHPRIDEGALRDGIASLVSEVLRSNALQTGHELLDGLLRNFQEKRNRK